MQAVRPQWRVRPGTGRVAGGLGPVRVTLTIGPTSPVSPFSPEGPGRPCAQTQVTRPSTPSPPLCPTAGPVPCPHLPSPHRVTGRALTDPPRALLSGSVPIPAHLEANGSRGPIESSCPFVTFGSKVSLGPPSSRLPISSLEQGQGQNDRSRVMCPPSINSQT